MLNLPIAHSIFRDTSPYGNTFASVCTGSGLDTIGACQYSHDPIPASSSSCHIDESSVSLHPIRFPQPYGIVSAPCDNLAPACTFSTPSTPSTIGAFDPNCDTLDTSPGRNSADCSKLSFVIQRTSPVTMTSITFCNTVGRNCRR
jgi:hypothetical protein